jgi:hypothetical protein
MATPKNPAGRESGSMSIYASSAFTAEECPAGALVAESCVMTDWRAATKVRQSGFAIGSPIVCRSWEEIAVGCEAETVGGPELKVKFN